jgi:hypothetical protein
MSSRMLAMAELLPVLSSSSAAYAWCISGCISGASMGASMGASVGGASVGYIGTRREDAFTRMQRENNKLAGVPSPLEQPVLA